MSDYILNENVREKVEALNEAVGNQFGVEMQSYFIVFTPKDPMQPARILENIALGCCEKGRLPEYLDFRRYRVEWTSNAFHQWLHKVQESGLI